MHEPPLNKRFNFVDSVSKAKKDKTEWVSIGKVIVYKCIERQMFKNKRSCKKKDPTTMFQVFC
jgi:hypothetical protein